MGNHCMLFLAFSILEVEAHELVEDTGYEQPSFRGFTSPTYPADSL
jgi:hypothetical protein